MKVPRLPGTTSWDAYLPPRLAWSLSVACLVGVGASLVLQVLNGTALDRLVQPTTPALRHRLPVAPGRIARCPASGAVHQ